MKAARMVWLGLLTLLPLIVSAADVAPDAKTSQAIEGDWVLCHDDDGGAKDSMRFFPEGYGFSIRSERPKVPFLYKIADDRVLLFINAKGNLTNLILDFDAGHDKLMVRSERTHGLAVYVRDSDVSRFDCDTK